MIDVGDHRLYLECTGSGSPIVVLQSGLGESSSYWGGIAPVVAASTTVCAYDRAGHGRSDEAGSQDGIALAADLHTLLERAGLAGPFVLVGHSSGGAYVRVFADRYPDEVAGVVLLDAQPADAFVALPDYPAFYESLRTVSTLYPSLARIGFLAPILGLPADQSTAAAARGARDEVRALPEALQQALAATSLGDRPLVVVTAGSGQQDGWLEAQDRLAHLSTNSSHRVLTAATHASLISGADAGASSQAIVDIVSSLRAGTATR
jgi:pimeloyl-ACP methyl ester carboxylesterase